MADPDIFTAGEPEGFFDGWSADLSGVDEQAVQPTRRQTRPNHRRTAIERPDFRMCLLNFGPTFQPSVQEGPGTPPGDPDFGYPNPSENRRFRIGAGDESTCPEQAFRRRGILFIPPHSREFGLNQIILVYLGILCISM